MKKKSRRSVNGRFDATKRYKSRARCWVVVAAILLMAGVAESARRSLRSNPYNLPPPEPPVSYRPTAPTIIRHAATMPLRHTRARVDALRQRASRVAQEIERERVAGGSEGPSVPIMDLPPVAHR